MMRESPPKGATRRPDEGQAESYTDRPIRGASLPHREYLELLSRRTRELEVEAGPAILLGRMDVVVRVATISVAVAVLTTAVVA